MSEKIIADTKPAVVNLEQGKTYYFCSCGRSANQPFCDGKHQDSGFEPMAFVADKDGPAYLCACKQSNKQPFCDGSHTALST